MPSLQKKALGVTPISGYDEKKNNKKIITTNRRYHQRLCLEALVVTPISGYD